MLAGTGPGICGLLSSGTLNSGSSDRTLLDATILINDLYVDMASAVIWAHTGHLTFVKESFGWLRGQPKPTSSGEACCIFSTAMYAQTGQMRCRHRNVSA